MLALLLASVIWLPEATAQQQDRDWDDCGQMQDRERSIRVGLSVISCGGGRLSIRPLLG